MKLVNWGLLMLLVLSASLAGAQIPPIAVTVDCSRGQSLNSTLLKLNKNLPTVVYVKGTCTEFVQVSGFDNLTLKGLPGATLSQPSTGGGNFLNAALLIESSRSIIVDGFNIQADTATGTGIGIGHGSTDVRLRNLHMQGGGEGIIIFERSQVSLAYVTGKDAGYTPLGIYDSSDVHVEHCVFDNSSGAFWHAGVDLGSSHLTIYATAIRNMQVGINASAGSAVDVQTFTTYYPAGGPSDVTIENQYGTNFDGVSLSAGSRLNVLGAKLAINQPGQPWGGTTGGVLVSDGSVLSSLYANLVITGSHGQGIVVDNNSHATLVGSSVTGSGHGGLVLANLSSIDVSAGNGNLQTLIGGNAVDLFCDSNSTITGSASFAGVPTSQCANVFPAEASLP
jgi:Right handed beta helix region